MLRNLFQTKPAVLRPFSARWLSNASPSGSKNNSTGLLEGYGDNVFKGAVALPYLKKQGLSLSVLDSGKWTTDGNADKVGRPSSGSSSFMMRYLLLLYSIGNNNVT